MADDQDYINSLLEAAVSNTKRTKALDLPSREIDAFVAFKDVREGPNNVPLDIIYHAYRQWSNKPMPIDKFRKLFNKRFKQQSRWKNYYYKIEADSFDLPDYYSITTDPNYLRRKTTTRHPRLIGVWRHAKYKWFAKLLLPTGLYLPLGTYKSAFEAAHTYDEAALLVYGRDAVLNFPRKWSTLLNGKKDIPLVYRHKINEKWFQSSVKRAKTEQVQYQKHIEALSR